MATGEAQVITLVSLLRSEELKYAVAKSPFVVSSCDQAGDTVR